ncbi:MAG: PDZ domain-containing protein [Candidatus Zixiibacteriota bacterium]
MNNSVEKIKKTGFTWLLLAPALLILTAARPAIAQNFDFEKLGKAVESYTVFIDIKFEMSFGIHTNEQEDRYLGTIVSEDGLVMFDGSALASDNAFASFTGFSVKTTPTNIKVTTWGGQTYDAEYVGVDRFTRIGFLRITNAGDKKFVPVKFNNPGSFAVGNWLALYMLLPEFVDPPVAADVGMISAVVQSPEYFPLTVGFNVMQITSVLFNESLQPVGVLGLLDDPAGASMDPSGMLESFDQFGMPLLGVVTADRVTRLIADPPQKGRIDRGWLGITLQALTTDMANFWGLDTPGGIIVNDIVKNSPAAEAGLQVGDVIYAVNGQPVEVDKEEEVPVFQRFIAELGPDAAVEFSIIRLAENQVDSLTLLAKLQSAPMGASDAPEYENKALEFTARDLVFGDYLFYNLDSDTFKGVVVSELKQGGLADLEGLSVGDIIQRLGSAVVTNVDELKAAMEEIEKARPSEVIFFVWRDNKTLFVNIKTDW